MARSMKIGGSTPMVLQETIYLHLKPTVNPWNNVLEGVVVRKMAKSLDAAVEPGDYIVKLHVEVPPEFFIDSMPSARIEIEPGKIVPVMVEQVEED